MAIVDTQGLLIIPGTLHLGAAAPAFSAIGTMNDSNDKAAYIVQVPKTGTLDWFECRQLGNSNAPDNGLRFSFQNLTTGGVPDATQDQYRAVTSGFGANAWLVPPGVMTNNGTDGGTKRSVTVGDWIACVVEFESFVAGDSITMSGLNVSTGASGAATHTAHQYIADFETAWTRQLGTGPIALKYNDSTYGVLPLAWAPILTVNANAFGSGSSPAYRGMRFRLPFNAQVTGAWVRMVPSADCTLTLYDNSDNVLASVTIDGDHDPATAGQNTYLWFNAKVSLTKNTTYRLILQATEVTSITLYDFDISAAALMAAVPGGVQWYSSTGSPGAWVDVTTNRPLMGLLIDGVDDGSGAGGANVPFFG